VTSRYPTPPDLLAEYEAAAGDPFAQAAAVLKLNQRRGHAYAPLPTGGVRTVTGPTIPPDLSIVAHREYVGERPRSSRCPWRIHWGTTPEATTQCDKPEHVTTVAVDTLAGGRLAVTVEGDGHHDGPGLYDHQRISWLAGDRREYRGEWPGPCAKLPGQPLAGGCTLHTGHHGRCAP